MTAGTGMLSVWEARSLDSCSTTAKGWPGVLGCFNSGSAATRTPLTWLEGASLAGTAVDPLTERASRFVIQLPASLLLRLLSNHSELAGSFRSFNADGSSREKVCTRYVQSGQPWPNRPETCRKYW